MRFEDAAGGQAGFVVLLVHAPDVDVAMVVAGCEERTIVCDAD